MLRKLHKSAVLLSRPRNRAALLRHAVAGAIEHDVVLRSRPWDIVIDAGANRGQFSLAVRHFLPGARIVAFEPLASAAGFYRKIFARDPRVQLHETAIGRQKGTATMQRSASEDSSSMLPIGDLMQELFPGTQAVGTESVAVAPLTDFLTAEDLRGNSLLKIDVQGYELEVLASAEPLLPFLDTIYVETSFVTFYEGQALADEVISYLQARGFKITGIMNPSFHPVSGAAVQADMLFVNTNRRAGH
jgi:FkbM family methyltransferase